MVINSLICLVAKVKLTVEERLLSETVVRLIIYPFFFEEGQQVAVAAVRIVLFHLKSLHHEIVISHGNNSLRNVVMIELV